MTITQEMAGRRIRTDDLRHKLRWTDRPNWLWACVTIVVDSTCSCVILNEQAKGCLKGEISLTNPVKIICLMLAVSFSSFFSVWPCAHSRFSLYFFVDHPFVSAHFWVPALRAWLSASYSQVRRYVYTEGEGEKERGP